MTSSRGLDRVFRLRERAERDQKAALGAARRDEEARREQADSAREHMERCHDQSGERKLPAAAGLLRALARPVEAARERLDEALEAQGRAAEAALAEEERLKEARRDRRAVEKVRDRRRAEEAEGASRAEQQAIDEFTRHQRARGGREA